MRYSTFALAMLLAFATPVASLAKKAVKGGQNPGSIYNRSFTHEDEKMAYYVIYPKGYDPKSKTKFPLIVFLHDSTVALPDNRPGLDNITETPFVRNLQRLVKDDSINAIVLAPIVKKSQVWAECPQQNAADKTTAVPFDEKPNQTYAGEMAQSLVDYYVKNYPVDKGRVYVIGQGTIGGSGALDLAARNPDVFAAVVSAGGAISPDRVKPLVKTPVLLYGSSQASRVPITLVRDVYIGLKSQGSSVVEPVVDFNNVSDDECATMAGSQLSLYRWLFAQKKK